MRQSYNKNKYPYTWTKFFIDLFWLTIILTLLVNVVKIVTEQSLTN